MPPGPGGPGSKGPGTKTAAADAGKLGFSIKLTKEQQNNLAAAVLITALAVFAYVRYWAMPVLKAYKEKTAVLEQKKKELADAREMVSKYSEFMARANEINAKIDFINKRLPVGANIADTIREMTTAATESGISIINYQPGKEVNRGDHKEYVIGVIFQTNYRNLGKFLTRIGYVERLIVPGDLMIQRLPETPDNLNSGNNIGVSMKIKIYSLAE